MLRNALRAALAAALVTVAPALPAPAAHAAGSCGTGQVVAAGMAGTVEDWETDWYRVTVAGTARVVLAMSGQGTDLRVYDSSCVLRCSVTNTAPAKLCTLSHTGTLNVAVIGDNDPISAYVLTVASDAAVPDLPDTSCAGSGLCVTTEVGSGRETVAVYGATTYTAATHAVAGWLDVYRFALPNGAAVTVPCVVLTADGTTNDPCGAADGEFVTRLATLVDRTVDEPAATLGPPLASASVCNARYTVTVASVGVEDFPAYSLC